VQRRYQKLIEEAPPPGLEAGLRDRLRAAAVALGEHLGYRGAGTVEFLVDAERGRFYFLEVNARIQVEHPVTEAVTGLDIVAEQIAIAEGGPFRLRQEDVTFAGHAIECRINAEDPARDFRPSPGMVSRAVFPVSVGGGRGTRGSRDIGGERDARERGGGAAGWVRVDTHVQAGAAVPAYYDSLLAKVIAHGVDRDAALRTWRDALERCVIDGVVTNLKMQRAVIGSPGFAGGGVDTGYLGRWLAGGSGAGDGIWLAEEPGDADGPESPGSVRDDAGLGPGLDRGAGRGVADG
jgi:acetyl-CoA carboxylase, biotin carboxylase subunit